MPELGRFWADAGSIVPEPAEFWYITAGLQIRDYPDVYRMYMFGEK